MADHQSNEDDDTSRIPPSDIWNNGVHNNQHTRPAHSPLENEEDNRVLQQHQPLSGWFASEQHNINNISNGLSSILNPFNLRRSLPTTSLLMKRIGKTLAISSTAIFLLIVFPLLFNSAIHDAKMGRTDFAVFYSAASFVTITLVFSFREILSHLYNWYAPDVQKFVVRILFMVPLYSVQSWLSLRFHGPARVYIDTIRDLYEAYVIQSFVYYLIELLGGEERITEILSNKDSSLGQHPRCMAKLLGRWDMGQDFLYKIKHGVLQYVVMKTVTTLLTTFVLLPSGYYGEGTFTYHSAYIYITAILNISVMYALYCLVKLFHAVKSDLRSPVNWHPVGKFLCVKGVVFFTYWQGVGINFLRWHGVIPDQVGSWSGDEVAGGIIDYLVCVEMVFFSIAHMFTFTYKEYLPEGMEEKKKSGIVGWLFEGIDKQRRKRNPNQQQPALQSALLHGDHDDEEVVGFVDENGNIAEASYSPPASSGFRRLEDPLRLREALWSSTVPTETLDDIKRLGVVSSQGYSYGQVAGVEESHLEQPSIDISLSSMQNAEKI